MKADRTEKGRYYESVAAAFLEAQGYEILCRNFRTRSGEIDLIGREAGSLCFIEVKYRSYSAYGMPSEFVDRKKQLRIMQASRTYMTLHRCERQPVRYDVVEIIGRRIRVIRDAFGSTF